MDYTARGKQVIDQEIEGLKTVRDKLDSGFADATQILLDCLKNDRKIVVTGVGKSLHIAGKVAATLTSTGATSITLDPTHAMHGDLGVLNAGDTLLAFSYSGESDELLALIPLVRRQDVKIVAITGATDAPLAKNSDVAISVEVASEACPFNMAPTTSTTAMLAMGDAIAMAILDARGLTEEDYAQFHPGGAIGRALLLRVSDIMRKDNRLAIVTKGQLVKEAVLAMTGARSGSAAVVTEDKSLLGILTDGDLRRHLASDPDIMSKVVDEIMTPSPVTVMPDQLAAEALRIFAEKDIDDILVVDDNNHVVGAVDIQDLPKLKIM